MMHIKPLAFSLFLLALFIKPCFVQAQVQSQSISPKELKALIDSLCNALTTSYIYRDKAVLMVSTLKKNYKEGAYSKIKNKPELGIQLHEDIQQVCKDLHLSISFEPQQAARLEAHVRQQEPDTNLRNAYKNNFAFKKAEVLTGNIGYIRWDGFLEFVEEAKPTLDSSFQLVSNCNALIIDMRHNGGGSPAMVLQIQSYFFKDKTHMNDIIYRNNDTLKRYAEPGRTSFKLSMPVYILTSRQTFSAAEDFTYGMQQAKRAVVIGDTTGGGAHPTGPVNIGQGFIAFIPFARAPEGKDWENIGVRPDIPVPAEQALTTAQLAIEKDLHPATK